MKHTNKDIWGRPGEKVSERWSEGGGYEIFRETDHFNLYEIPQYGGDPRFSDSFPTLIDAINAGNNFT